MARGRAVICVCENGDGEEGGMETGGDDEEGGFGHGCEDECCSWHRAWFHGQEDRGDAGLKRPLNKKCFIFQVRGSPRPIISRGRLSRKGNMHVMSPLRNVRALLFDVFGTVVDWHGCIVNELEQKARGTPYEDESMSS